MRSEVFQASEGFVDITLPNWYTMTHFVRNDQDTRRKYTRGTYLSQVYQNFSEQASFICMFFNLDVAASTCFSPIPGLFKLPEKFSHHLFTSAYKS